MTSFSWEPEPQSEVETFLVVEKAHSILHRRIFTRTYEDIATKVQSLLPRGVHGPSDKAVKKYLQWTQHAQRRTPLS